MENHRDYAEEGLFFTRGARGGDLSDFVLQRSVSQSAFCRGGSNAVERTFYDKLVRGPSLTGGIPTNNPLPQLVAPQAAEGTATRESSHLNNLLPRPSSWRQSAKQLFLFSPTSCVPAMDLTGSKWTCRSLFVTFTATGILPTKPAAVGA